MSCISEDLKCWAAWDTASGHKAKAHQSINRKRRIMRMSERAKRARKVEHHSPDQHWNFFKGSAWNTEKQGEAHEYFPQRVDTTPDGTKLNWTALTWSERVPASRLGRRRRGREKQSGKKDWWTEPHPSPIVSPPPLLPLLPSSPHHPPCSASGSESSVTVRLDQINFRRSSSSCWSSLDFVAVGTTSPVTRVGISRSALAMETRTSGTSSTSCTSLPVIPPPLLPSPPLFFFT